MVHSENLDERWGRLMIAARAGDSQAYERLLRELDSWLRSCGLDSLVIKEFREPEPRAEHVIIQVKAFVINHAEVHMRRGCR